MKEELITFETAKLARERGFNISTAQRYIFRYAEHDSENYIGRLTDEPLTCDILAPTQSLLQRWLRETHNIMVFIVYESLGSDEWGYDYEIIYTPKEFENAKRRVLSIVKKESHYDSGSSYSGVSETYELALESALLHALKLIP